MVISLEIAPGGPDVSFIMPCYNEEAIVSYTIQRLMAAFDKAGYRLEVVAVDNGSRDRTGEILRSLAIKDSRIRPHRVEVNEGYGHGILSGIPLCSAPWVGIIPADGQVDAEDVVRLFEAAVTSGQKIIAKVRRRFRMDGVQRKVISISYNAFIRLLWPRLGSIDVNGSPKLMPRDIMLQMHLRSKDWFLDPEIMLKAHALGLRVLELNVFARMRGNGISHVRTTTCWEFIRNLLRYRFTQAWKQDLQESFQSEPMAKPCIGAAGGRS